VLYQSSMGPSQAGTGKSVWVRKEARRRYREICLTAALVGLAGLAGWAWKSNQPNANIPPAAISDGHAFMP